MQNIKLEKITDSAEVKLDTNLCELNFATACHRFFKSASMLPANTSLGMKIFFNSSGIPDVTAFSDASLTVEDYEWIFKTCAETVTKSKTKAHALAGRRTYLFSEGDSEDKEMPLGICHLLEDLCVLSATMFILVPSGSKYAYVMLQTENELPLRVRAMLSNGFHGAEISRVEMLTNELNKGLPCKVVSENIKSLFSAISEKKTSIHMEQFVDDLEMPLIDDESETMNPIEELSLSVRSFNCLKRAGVHTIAQLRAMSKDDLMKVRNLGKKNCEEVLQKLREYNPDTETELKIQSDRSGREMLDELIGLREVKMQVKRIAAFAKLKRDMEETGHSSEPITLNMAFTGNPGTAKTTVARIMAMILYEVGILKKCEPLEVGRADIVARYTGQTADNVKAIFRKAKGGLLFVDEAYSLLEEWENGFGDEAINAIVQEMENCRSDTVVVFAGYPKPMEKFLSRNPGLRSRVPFHIGFADYSAEEMMEIAVQDADRRGFSVHPKAKDKLIEICTEACKQTENGNGRFCRNLIEGAILSYAERVYGESKEAAKKDFILMPEDLCFLSAPREEKRTQIGFDV